MKFEDPDFLKDLIAFLKKHLAYYSKAADQHKLPYLKNTAAKMNTILFDFEQGSPTKKALKKDLKASEKSCLMLLFLMKRKPLKRAFPLPNLTSINKLLARCRTDMIFL